MWRILREHTNGYKKTINMLRDSCEKDNNPNTSELLSSKMNTFFFMQSIIMSSIKHMHYIPSLQAVFIGLFL